MPERLQKLISAAGLASRRRAEEMILAGRVTVNGETAGLGMRADPLTDDIRLDGVPVTPVRAHTYVMLNKPRGYVTTLRDEKGRRTVSELVQGAGTRLYPVGRLDLNSDGLLLMTDDGDLAQRLTHPSHEVEKTYRTAVEGDVDAALPILRSPMELDGKPIRPAAVERVGDSILEITIHEGRNRQVRRMCAAAGLRVLRLTRISEGPLHLGSLAPGQWRRLTAEELELLRRL